MGLKSVFCDIFGIETKEEQEARIKQEQAFPEAGATGGSPASQKEKAEKAEREWKDMNEDFKFVCQGGKVQCPFGAPPIADIIVTSSTIMLQDKPWATVKDKDGRVNFNFTGVCNHPSQQKPSAPPPPCKAVISLGEWKNYSDTMVGDNNALLVKSTIPCNISGQDLKIIHSGQMAVLTQIKPKVKKNPHITKAYWIDENNKRIKKILPNKYASLVIETEDYSKNDKVTVKLPINREEKEFVGYPNNKGIVLYKDIFFNTVEKAD